jgi:hypothetical protein
MPIDTPPSEDSREAFIREYDRMEPDVAEAIRVFVEDAIKRGQRLGTSWLVTKPMQVDLDHAASIGEVAVFRITELGRDGDPWSHHAVSQTEYTRLLSSPCSFPPANFIYDFVERFKMILRPDLEQAWMGAMHRQTVEYRYSMPESGIIPADGHLRSSSEQAFYTRPLRKEELVRFAMQPLGSETIEEAQPSRQFSTALKM